MADSNKHDLEFLYMNKERKKEEIYSWHMFNISFKQIMTWNETFFMFDIISLSNKI